MVAAEQLKKSSCLDFAGAGGNWSHGLQCAFPLPQPGLGAKGGSRQEQIGFSDRKKGMQNARRNFD